MLIYMRGKVFNMWVFEEADNSDYFDRIYDD